MQTNYIKNVCNAMHCAVLYFVYEHQLTIGFRLKKQTYGFQKFCIVKTTVPTLGYPHQHQYFECPENV